MKYFFLLILSLSFVACASQRGPASTDQQDVKDGINTDYYFTR